MKHEDMLNLLGGLVFHAQEDCGSRKRYEDLDEFEKRVEKLIYKDMPMLVIKHGFCPNCERGLPYEYDSDFCDRCGQAIKWEDEE